MNEIPMKQWRHEMALRFNVAASSIANYISPTRRAKLSGKRKFKRNLNYPVVRRVNSRVVFVQIES